MSLTSAADTDLVSIAVTVVPSKRRRLYGFQGDSKRPMLLSSICMGSHAVTPLFVPFSTRLRAHNGEHSFNTPLLLAHCKVQPEYPIDRPRPTLENGPFEVTPAC